MAVIALKGVRNARDLGGIQTPDGRLKPHMLIRSAHLGGATAGDIGVLRGDAGVSRIVDLRTRREHEEMPDVPMPGVDHALMPIFDQIAVGITHETAGATGVSSVDPSDMEALYRTMVTGACRDRLAEAVRSIMEHDYARGAVLFHCTEGKDRTGIVALTLLSILGVPYDAIVEDYLFTNKANARRARQYWWAALIGEHSRSAARSVHATFTAHETYLAAAIGAMRAEFGSVERFIEQGLRIDEASARAFRKTLLE